AFLSKRPLPVATSRLPVPGSTAAPERDQIAEPLSAHDDGLISACLSLQSAFQTRTSRPVEASIAATWPWYGGVSPKYPPVVAITSPRERLSAVPSFSREGSSVIATDQRMRPEVESSL